MENLEVVATTSIATDGTVQSVEMDEGRIVNTGGGVFQYEYNMQDHLGTNRVSFRMTTDSTLALSMVQNYYPFGQDMGDSTMNFSLSPLNFYKYNGKEIQPELDLDTYDFGARHYDPVLGRWMGVDALASRNVDFSPFNYVANNPLNLIDPDGMQASSPDFTYGASGYGNIGGDASFTKYGGIKGSGSSIGGIGLGAANFGAQFVSAMRAFSFKGPTSDHLNDNLGRVQGNAAPRSSIPNRPDPISPNSLTHMSFEMRNQIELSSRPPKIRFNIPVGTYNPNTHMIQGSGQADGFYPENTLIAVGATVALGGALAPELVDIESATWAQRTFSAGFSEGGQFAGRTISDIAGELRAGTMTVNNVPIEVVVRDGKTIILNTRSSVALMEANIPRSAWKVVNVTNDYGAQIRLFNQLYNNGLLESNGTNMIRQTGTKLIWKN